MKTPRLLTEGLLAVCLATFLWTTAANGQSDEQAIRACFRNYQAAIARQDGNTAAALISKDSLTYYGSILKPAVNADETNVRQQHYYRKMMILLVRHEAAHLYSTNGYSTNASQFFAYLVKRGWGGNVAAPGVELGKITIGTDGILASVQGVLSGQVTPAALVFQRERDGWKVSLLDAILRLDRILAEKQKNSALSEDDAIIQALEKRSGHPVSADIWRPLRRR